MEILAYKQQRRVSSESGKQTRRLLENPQFKTILLSWVKTDFLETIKQTVLWSFFLSFV